MTTYIVTNNNDSGFGSLRQAIIDANSNPGADTIEFDPGVTFITLTSGELLITDDLTIINNNAGTLTISGDNNSRIFNIDVDSTVTLTNLIITNGSDTNGGAIYNNGTLTINDSTISNNTATGIAGGIYNDNTMFISNTIITENTASGGAGVYNGSLDNLTIDNSTISNNIASDNGGGILNILGTVIINYSTVDGNTSGSGGGITNAGSFTVTNSTISNNTSNVSGGAVFNTSSFGLTNSTVSGNTSRDAGGGITNIQGTVTIRNSTISNNSAVTLGGGIITQEIATTNVGNTIVAENSAPTSPDVNGIFISAGNNLIGDGTGSNFINGVNNDQVGTAITPIDPLLNPLGDYGGPTQTMTLQYGSSAIDAGSNALIPGGIIYDQRGPGYQRIINEIVDIGAIEANTICYSGESSVLTKNILTGEIADIKAKDVFSDVHEVFDTANKIFVPVKLNIISGTTKKFRKIKKNSLGENQPSEDFYVTSGHVLVINGKEVKARNIPQAKKIRKKKKEKLYSICTEKRVPIVVNGLDVMSWGYDEWMEKVSKTGIAWANNVPAEQSSTQKVNSDLN
ncbi:hypothetical protein QJ856_gp1224 [Tupanvirus deep ocean]|uniref:Uncharacterized protein n=2 Tax=Tupanvirus TaxID=2094720 RepID=A0AC62A6Y2_9VIRU|nr:hypothetical protein QJ856_gp1224 [Tupanvirus deep ocean]QKU33541.1 hypothetical protein [Tupanvirus deep ocean]